MTRNSTDGHDQALLRIGTRGSRLARWQAEWVAEQLRGLHKGLKVELIEIRTRGDRDRNSPLASIAGGTGLFTKEIQRALLDQTVDLAVHSLKDLPTKGPEGLILAAVPVREAVADVLIAPIHRMLEALPTGSRIGTGSLRRQAQLRHLRPDLEVVGIRGNLETRLDKAKSGECDGVILAEAGLRRLGLDAEITELLNPPGFLPAVGQGALGIECRADDETTQQLLKILDDAPTHRAVLAERSCLAAVEAGCMLPMAGWARDHQDTESGKLVIDAVVLDPGGTTKLSVKEVGLQTDPEGLGKIAAGRLLAQGAAELLRRSN